MIRRKRHSRQRVETGIRTHHGGLQACVRIRGQLLTKQFAADEITEARAWRARTKRQRFAGGERPVGTFGGDIEAYLRRRAAMPTINQVAAHLELWADALGRDRSRHSITTAAIDEVIQRWLAAPDPDAPPPRYEAGRKGRLTLPCGLDKETIRKRRSTLRTFFNVTNGKKADNPVTDAQNFAPKKPEIRGTDYATIARILAAMPDYKSHRAGTPPREVNLSKLRAAVIAYAGLPPSMLAQLTAADVTIAGRRRTGQPHGWIRVPARDKGDGVEARTLPLSAYAAQACAALLAADGFRPFEASPLNRSWQRGRRRAGVTQHLTIYDLRHSFGAEVYRLTGDEATVGRMLLHAEGSPTTSRYTRGAHAAVDTAAMAAFSASLSGARGKVAQPVAQRPANSRGRNNLRKSG